MQSKIYLPGLNGIRAIAASCVIIAHVAENVVTKGLFNRSYFGNFGGYAVFLFFTLSGFLITYLLLKEIEKKDKIDIKKFYIRRILRIWPLYFLYILLILFVLNFRIPKSIFYYLFMIPNVAFSLQLATGFSVAIPLLIHYWSLGVEEQFYAFWPWLISFSKKIKTTMILFCVGYFGLKVFCSLIHAPIELQSVLLHTPFSCLSIGGIGAYLYYEKNKLLTIINNRFVDLSAWIILALFFTDYLRIFSIINSEIVSVAAIVVILNQINNPKPLLPLENKVFDYLGKISFGLYVYNPLVIYLLSFWLYDLPIENQYVKVAVIVVTNFLVIICISHLSYHYFEKRFLKLKTKYMTVKSVSSKVEFNEQN